MFSLQGDRNVTSQIRGRPGIAGFAEMKLGRIVVLGGCLALVSTGALAFEEQKPVSTPAPASAKAVGDDATAAVPLADTGAAAKADEGTEVRIPGLGKLGVLPKMDFGLELLYGANDPKPQEQEVETPVDDLTIRGTVKHKF